MKKLFLLICLLFLSHVFLFAQNNIWQSNCRQVVIYKGIKFMKTKSWKKGQDSRKAPYTYGAVRNEMIKILNSLKLEDVKKLKMMQEKALKIIKKAPKNKSLNLGFGSNRKKYDISLAEKDFNFISNLMTLISNEAEKRGINCN